MPHRVYFDMRPGCVGIDEHAIVSGVALTGAPVPAPFLGIFYLFLSVFVSSKLQKLKMSVVVRGKAGWGAPGVRLRIGGGGGEGGGIGSGDDGGYGFGHSTPCGGSVAVLGAQFRRCNYVSCTTDCERRCSYDNASSKCIGCCDHRSVISMGTDRVQMHAGVSSHKTSLIAASTHFMRLQAANKLFIVIRSCYLIRHHYPLAIAD